MLVYTALVEDDEKDPMGDWVHPVDVQLWELELKAKWNQQILDLEHKEMERGTGRLEQELGERAHAIWLKLVKDAANFRSFFLQIAQHFNVLLLMPGI